MVECNLFINMTEFRHEELDLRFINQNIEDTELVIDNTMDCLPPENDKGNIEYKCFLINNDHNKINHLITQMKWRMDQGYNLYEKKCAVYVIGVFDNGKIGNVSKENIQKSIEILQIVAEKCNATIKKIRYVDNPNGMICILDIISYIDYDYYPTLFD